MMLKYDEEADAAYVSVAGPVPDGAVRRSEDVSRGDQYERGIDYDADGCILCCWLHDGWIPDTADAASATQVEEGRNREPGMRKQGVDHVLSQRQRSRVAGSAGVGDPEKLQDADDGRFQLRHSVDPFAHVEGDV